MVAVGNDKESRKSEGSSKKAMGKTGKIAQPGVRDRRFAVKRGKDAIFDDGIMGVIRSTIRHIVTGSIECIDSIAVGVIINRGERDTKMSVRRGI